MFKVFQPVIVRIEWLSIFVVAGGSTSGRGSTSGGLVPAIFQPRIGNKKRPQGDSISGRSQLQEYQRAFYHSGIVVPMSHKNLEHRQAVTEYKISDNGIPYMVDNSKFDPTYCVPLVPNSYSVTACRQAQRPRFGP